MFVDYQEKRKQYPVSWDHESLAAMFQLFHTLDLVGLLQTSLEQQSRHNFSDGEAPVYHLPVL